MNGRPQTKAVRDAWQRHVGNRIVRQLLELGIAVRVHALLETTGRRPAAQEAVSTLKQAQAIRSTLTGIKTSSDKARAGLDALVESVRARLERIESLVGDEAEQLENLEGA